MRVNNSISFKTSGHYRRIQLLLTYGELLTTSSLYFWLYFQGGSRLREEWGILRIQLGLKIIVKFINTRNITQKHKDSIILEKTRVSGSDRSLKNRKIALTNDLELLRNSKLLEFITGELARERLRRERERSFSWLSCLVARTTWRALTVVRNISSCCQLSKCSPIGT